MNNWLVGNIPGVNALQDQIKEFLSACGDESRIASEDAHHHPGGKVTTYWISLEDARNKLSYDLYYAKNHGLFLDLIILLQTIRVILWADGSR